MSRPAPIASRRRPCRSTAPVLPGARGGFTLLELVIALAVLGLMLRAALPSLAGVAEALTLRSLADDLVADLQLARSAALQRNGRAVLCKAPGPDCLVGVAWEQGWMVFHDANGNGQADPGEEVLARRQALPAGWRVSGNGPVASYVAYGAMGTARLRNGGFQAGTLTVCRAGAPAPVAARQVVVNAVGRPRVQAVQLPACP